MEGHAAWRRRPEQARHRLFRVRVGDIQIEVGDPFAADNRFADPTWLTCKKKPVEDRRSRVFQDGKFPEACGSLSGGGKIPPYLEQIWSIYCKSESWLLEVRILEGKAAGNVTRCSKPVLLDTL